MRRVADYQRHVAEVNRASFADCDGHLFVGSRMWRDGRAFVEVFWTYYAEYIEDHMHGRALRALAEATIDGMRPFAKSSELRAVLSETMTPFMKKKHRRERGNECAYCTRPYEGKQQCAGCGAWRRDR